MKKEAAKKNRKWLLPVIIAAAVLVIAGILLAIFLGPWNQGGTQSGKVNSKLYWNVDRLQFVEEETGFSLRTKGEDGLFTIRFAVDGEQVELKTADKRLVNSIDMLNLMGLIFDADGLITDLVLPTDVAVETAFEFFVQEVTDTTITINSSMAMTGMSMTIDLTENTGIYNVSPRTEVVGQKDTCELMDKVSVYSNEAGEVTHVFITERNPEAGIYIRSEAMYDSLTGQTTREPDENGAYTIQFAHEGELVELKCKDKTIVSQIDGSGDGYMGLLFDEEGYISETVNVAVALRGKQACVRYHVTAIEGDMVTLESIWYTNKDIGNTVTLRVREDCDIFTGDTNCGAEFRGQRVESLQVNDFVTLYTDLEDQAIFVFIQTRMVEGPLYYNINRSWNGEGTKRTPDENGYYVFRVIAPTGLKEYRTKDKSIADKADKHYCFGLKLQGNIILDAYDPRCVTGASSAGIGYYVSEISGPVTRIVSSSNFESGTNYMSAADCLVFDASDRYSTKIGTKTTLRVGDKVTAYKNPSNELTYVYVTTRYIEGTKIYYNVNRQYDSTLKETRRVANEEGYYVFDMICEGKTVQVKTKDKALANYIEEKICSALLVSNGIIKDAAAPESAIKYGIHALNNYYVNSFKADGILEVYYGSVDNRTYRDIAYKLSNKTKIYNVGDGYLNYQGETTKLQKDDYIYGYASVQTGELEVVLVRGRKMDTKLYWQVSQKYNSTTKETTREPNAEGYYVFDLLVDGEIKQFKTKDKAIASKVDSYSNALGLRLNGDIILQAYGPESIKGLSGVLSSFYDVMTMNGSKLHLVRNQVNSSQRGKETDIELAANYKVYDVSPSAKVYGEPGTIGIGDRLYCLGDSDGKASVIYILYKSTRKAGATGYCEHCGKEVWWEPYNSVYAVQDAHYYLTADMTKSERSVGYSKERLEEDPTLQQYEAVLDLNGFTLTSENRRNFSLYSTLSIIDSAGGGKLVGFEGGRAGGNFYMYAGSTLNLYGGELCGSGPDMIQSKGGIIFANEATINVYGGKIAGGRAQMGGNIYLTNATLNIYGGELAGDILADTKSTVALIGKVTVTKGLYEGIKVNPDARIDVSKLDPASSVVVSAEGVFTTEHANIAKFQNAFVPLYDRDSIAVEGKALTYVKGEIPAEEVAANIEEWIAANAAAFTAGTNLPTDCPCCVGLVSWVAIDGTEGAQVTASQSGPKTHFYLSKDMTISGDHRFFRSGVDACLYLNGKTVTYNGSSDVFHAGAAHMNIFGDGNAINNGTGNMFAYNGAGVVKLYGGNYTQNGAEGMFDDYALVPENTEGTHVLIYGGTFNVDPATYNRTCTYSNVVTVVDGYESIDNGNGTWTVQPLGPEAYICSDCGVQVEWEEYSGQHNSAETALTAADGHKHYKLTADYSNKGYVLYVADGTACFNLGGREVKRASGAVSAFYNEAGKLSIMGKGNVTGGENSAIQLGSGAAVVNLYGGTFTKYTTESGGYRTTPVVNLTAGGTVNLYDGATITTEGKYNNRGGSCVNLRGDAENKAVFNMYGGVVTIAGSAANDADANNPGGAIATGRPVASDAASNAEVNILGGTVTGADLANSIGDAIYIKAGTSLTIGGTAVINGEVTAQNADATITLSGTPKVLAQEGGNGLVLGGAQANIDALEAAAQIQITPKAGDVLTAASENAATVYDCFAATNDLTIDLIENQLVIPATCSGCGQQVVWEVYSGQHVNADTALTAADGHKHYRLSANFSNSSYALYITDGTACFDLGGYNITRAGGGVSAFYNAAGTLNIIGEGLVTGAENSAIQLGSGAAVVNLYGGTFTKYTTATGGYRTTPVVNLTAGGTVNLYEGATLTTDGKYNNRGGSCVYLVGNAENKAVFNMFGGVVIVDDLATPWTAEDAQNQQAVNYPGGAIAIGRLAAAGVNTNAEVNISGGLVKGGDLANAAGDCIFVDRFGKLTISGDAMILGEVTAENANSTIILSGTPTIMAEEGGNGLVLNGAQANIDALEPGAQIQVTAAAGTVLTQASENINAVKDCFTFTGEGVSAEIVNGQLVIPGGTDPEPTDPEPTDPEPTDPEPTDPEVPEVQLPTICPGCNAENVTWVAITGEESGQITASETGSKTHFYLAEDNITVSGDYRFLRSAVNACLYLNGKTVTYTGSTDVFHAASETLNICGEGTVINNGTGPMFNYNGAGRVNIFGGTYVQNGTAGMFEDKILVDGQTTHVMIYGGTFDVNPAELTFTNEGVVTIAEGYEVTDNGNGTWTVAEPAPVVLPTTCPGCGMDLAEGDWTPWSGEYGSQQVFAPGQHIYLTGDYTQTGVGRAINMGDGTANALCWFLNGYDIIRTNETPSYAMIDAGSKVINIFGDGNVTDMATNDQTLFRYSGAGEINIYGGNYTTSSTGGMFRDYTYTGTGAAHVVLYGGTFGFNPAELTFTNSNVLAIAEGYEVTDNGDGTWTVAEKALDLPTTCPGCQAENVVWTEVTGEEGKQIYVGDAEFPGTHYYIAKDITLDAGNNRFLRPYTADGCLYLAEGVTLTYNGNANPFHAGARTINIFGNGTVISNSTSPMFAYNGAGRINIFGGNFTQNGEVGMFADNAYADGQTIHVVIHGGTFNVNPATFDADMGYTRTNVALAEGLGTAINADGNWFVAEKTRICPACSSIVEPDQWEIYTGQHNAVETALTAADGHKHYKLSEDLLYDPYGMYIADGSACLDLAGYSVSRANSSTSLIAFYNEAGTLNIADSVGSGTVTGTAVTGDYGAAVKTGSGAAIVNLKGGTYTKIAGAQTRVVVDITLGGTVNLYDGATITTNGATNNRYGACVQMLGTSTDKAVFNMYGGIVTVGEATSTQSETHPGGAISTGRPNTGTSNAEVNILGGTVTGGNLANAVGDAIFIKNGTSLTIGGNAVINGEVAMMGADASLTLTGKPQILAQEGGNGLVLNGALANIDALEAEAQIQVTGAAGEVLTAASENAAAVSASFSVTTEGLTVKDENNQLVIAENLLQAMVMTLRAIFS